MFWVDELAKDILNKYPQLKKIIVRDEKTLSGRVHIGSVKGVVIHGVIDQALRELGIVSQYIYEYNDFDPMDELPKIIDQNFFKPFMGRPLVNVPSPDKKAKNFAEYFGDEFLTVIKKLGFNPTIIRSSDLYQDGHYNQWIKKIIDQPAEIRKIYKEVSGSIKPDDWYPLQIICENCGKVGTTKVTSIKNDKVSYKCLPDLVTWASGCGFQGESSPDNGKGKLPWKVEWAVKWASLNVTVEGSGKDHNAAGGSHQISERICQEILKMPVPYNIPYEFFLIGGKKMSSSKGYGASAVEIAELLPGNLLRYLMIKTLPNQPTEFNPEGSTIPNLFDQYDEASRQYFSPQPSLPDHARAFHFSQTDIKAPVQHFLPRFSQIAFLVQMPHLDPYHELEAIKGSPLTSEDRQEIDIRIVYAKKWLTTFAPPDYIFKIQPNLPNVNLSLDQKNFLKDVSDLISNKKISGPDLHTEIHSIRKGSSLEPRDAFKAIYLSLLGKDSGPQAGWFIDALDKDFVINRFNKASEYNYLTPKIVDNPVVPVGLKNNQIVIGKIETLTKHPNADKLNVCQINIGIDSLLNIICGAPNIKVGDIVPVSIVGALVYDELGKEKKVVKVKIRKIDSEGMLCSARELGLASDHDSIFLLNSDLEKHLGEPVHKYIVK